MALAIERTTIGGLEVTSQKLSATRSYRLLPKVARVLAPIGATLRGKKLAEIKSLATLDIADVFEPLSAALERLDEATADAILLETLASTSIVTADDKGQPIKYDLTTKAMIDLAFAGDIAALFKTLAFVLRLNYGDFFAASAGLVPQIPTPSS